MSDEQRLGFGAASFTRSSEAYIPETGVLVTDNIPRVTEGRIPRNIWKPNLSFSFSPSESRMFYNVGQGVNNLLDRMATLETAFLDLEVISLGTSSEGRPIKAYRLGPQNRKHFVIVMGVHGNEVDGANGTFKAVELLTTGAEWGPFRDEWTLLFVPTLNPDGWFHNTRNNAEVGPNSQTVNINRNWNWFWSDYVETTTESKGATAGSSLEVTALLNYKNGTGPFAGNGVAPFGFVLDQHANQIPGARCIARDPVLRHITRGPADGVAPEGMFPGGSFVEVYVDFLLWRMCSSMVGRRVREEDGPDLFIRRQRDRFLPSLHGYFASLGIPSVAIEEISVVAAGGRETYQSAANYRLDCTLAAAACVTTAFWEFKDAILLEKAGTNLLSNAKLRDWSSSNVLPSNFATSRGDIQRNDKHDPLSVRFLNDLEAVTLLSTTLEALPAASEYVSVGNAGLGKLAAVSQAMTGVFFLDLTQQASPNYAGTPALVLSHATRTGVKLGAFQDDKIDLIGGGTAAPSTGAVTTVSRVSSLSQTTPTQASVGNLNTARMFHAVADNFLASPASGSQRTYIFGGYDGAGTRLTSIEIWNPTTATSAVSTASLPTALSDAVAVFCPVDSKVYVFGGSTSLLAAVGTIYSYTIGSDSIATHGTSMLVALKFVAASFNPRDSKIWLFGGEKIDGTMSNKIYSFDPVTGVFQEESVPNGRNDSEYKDNASPASWTTVLGRSGAAHISEVGNGTGQIVVMGGRLTNTVGVLQTAIWSFDERDGSLHLSDKEVPGSFDYGSILGDTSYATVLSDDFGSGILPGNWDDPDGVWIDGGGFAEADIGLSGPLIVVPAIPRPMNGMTASVALNTASGAHPDLGIVLRGTYTGSTLTDGYRVRYSNDGINQVWNLERVVASVPTVLATLDVTADATRKVIATFRVLTFHVEERFPVLLTATYNSLSLFSFYDLSSDAISIAGQAALFGGAT